MQPKPSLLRVLQRAVFHSKSNGEAVVEVENALTAIFSEPQSRAALLLAGEGVTYAVAVNHLQRKSQA